MNVTLRPVTPDDLAAVAAVSLAQDLGWWGEAHGDADDAADDVARAIPDGTRVAEVDGALVGVGLLFPHGQASVMADPAHPSADACRATLLDWVIDAGAADLDTPRQDTALHGLLGARGFTPTRSSFELERDAGLADLPRGDPPAGYEFTEFQPGRDEHDVHDSIYAVWTDVPGHTHRPFDEWSELIIGGSRFDPRLVTIARNAGAGAIAGVSIGRVFDDVGWVMQIAVGHDHRRVGLGRALLIEALHRLVSVADLRRVGLSVEAANATALGLYRSVGLELTAEWIHCTPPSG